MDKIIILSATNRPDSNTLKVSRIYENIIKIKNQEVEILDFCLLPHNIAFAETFGERSVEFARLVEHYITAANKFIFVMPEYNGSFPGILKLFLDATHPRVWAEKKACLVGVSDGRAGNLRGMDHLTGILNYLKVHVLHNKIPISVIKSVLNANGNFIADSQMDVCVNQVEDFLRF